MTGAADEDPVLARILAWAEAEESVRLVVLTSTRAQPDGRPDELSDYDVIVALRDLDRFDPVAAYGAPAARWQDEHDVHGTTARWPPPTFRAHIPPRPTRDEYVALVEEFWWSATQHADDVVSAYLDRLSVGAR